MLRRFGRQLAVSACEGIRKITDFDAAVASFSTSTWAMDQGSTSGTISKRLAILCPSST